MASVRLLSIAGVFGIAAHLLLPTRAIASPEPLCAGVTIRPTDAASITSTINDHPNGTTFCFEPGTYRIATAIELKDGDNAICKSARKCIIDGASAVPFGLVTAWEATKEQLISGFVVQNFAQACLKIRALGRAENNELHSCETGAVVMGSAVRNYIHHNRRYGVSGGPIQNILIEGNEIAFNNAARYDTDDAGGSKIVGSKIGASVIWRNNKVHHNFGNGIWQDGNVSNTLVEGNEVYNNLEMGIFHEISWGAVIRNNKVYNNNLSEKNVVRSCWWGAQIGVNNSHDVDIYGNIVTAEYVNGICVANALRKNTAPFPTSLANVKVHNNTIRMRGTVKTGVVGHVPPPGVEFYDNTYYVDDLSGMFWQNMKEQTKQQWQATGQDTRGVFVKW